MIITTKLTIDMAKRQILEKVDAVQCDANTRAVAVTLIAGGLPWVPGGGLTVSVACKKPDRTSAWYDTLPDGAAACSVSENVVTATLAPEVLTAAGQVKAAIVFQDDSLNQLATFPFIIDVAENPAAGNAISNSYYRVQNLAQINDSFKDIISSLPDYMKKKADSDLNMQAKNVNAVKRLNLTDGQNPDTDVDIYTSSVGQDSPVLHFDHFDGVNRVIVRGVAEGIEESDAVTVRQLNAAMVDAAAKIFAATAFVNTAKGESIAVEDSADYPLQSLTVYGKFVQNGVGTPDAPVPIVSAGGERGSIDVIFAPQTDEVKILVQPQDKTVSENEYVSYTVKAVGNGLTYQWQYRSPSSQLWKNCGTAATPGSDTDTITAQVTKTSSINRIGQSYRCIITDSNGNSVTSSEVTMRVFNTNEPISITKQPKHRYARLGDTVTFTVEAEGEGLTYCWQWYKASDESWGTTNLPGNQTPTITAEVTEQRNGYQYRCVITDANGNTRTSYGATLNVRSEDQNIVSISTPGGLPGLPVSSGGNYTDENGQRWLCDTIENDKYMKRLAYHPYYVPNPQQDEDILSMSAYMSSTGALTEGAQVVHPLPKTYELDLDAETAAAINALRTYKPNTTIVNDAGAGMVIEYVADAKTYFDNKIAELATAMATN